MPENMGGGGGGVNSQKYWDRDFEEGGGGVHVRD